LVEAAEVLGNIDLMQRTRSVAVQMAQAVSDEALQPDGRVLSESLKSPQSGDLAWWVHAEALVGFQNAFQISGQEHFSAAAVSVWNFILKNFSDHQHGDWFKTLDPKGRPYPGSPKVGPWECPYHHSRACLEMLKRLN
jgi:cellobiose epimerase